MHHSEVREAGARRSRAVLAARLKKKNETPLTPAKTKSRREDEGGARASDELVLRRASENRSINI
jgi:hypothetical protein